MVTDVTPNSNAGKGGHGNLLQKMKIYFKSGLGFGFFFPFITFLFAGLWRNIKAFWFVWIGAYFMLKMLFSCKSYEGKLIALLPG